MRMNPRVSALMVLLSVVLIACPQQSVTPVVPVTPGPPLIEGTFRLEATAVQKCFPVVINPNLILGTLDASKVRYRYDFGDGSPVLETSQPVVSYIYRTSGVYTIRAKAFYGEFSDASIERTEPITVIASDRECAYIVKLKSAGATSSLKLQSGSLRTQSVVADEDGVLLTQFDAIFDGFAATFTPAAAARVKARSDVDQISVSAVGSLAQSSDAWQLSRVSKRNSSDAGQPRATNTARGIDVYVVDTGVLASHPEFEGRVKNGFNAINGGSDTNDTSSSAHGTMVASLIAGKSIGAAREANIIPVKITEDQTFQSYEVLKALDWIFKRHKSLNRTTSIVNLSLSFVSEQKLLLDSVIEDLGARGILFVVAAGNRANNAALSSPAKMGCSENTGAYSNAKANGIITVGAINRDDDYWVNSNWGVCVDLIAPGSGIQGANNDAATLYRTSSGTSFAAPLVSAAAALYLERNPSSTPAQIEAALVKDATTDRVKFAPNTPNLLTTNNRLLFIDSSLPPLSSVSVSVTPSDVTLQPGQTQIFTASVSGSSNTAVVWDFSSGTLSGSGNSVTLTAPSVAGVYTLSASSVADPSKKAEATFRVVSSPKIEGWPVGTVGTIEVIGKQADPALTVPVGSGVIRADGSFTFELQPALPAAALLNPQSGACATYQPADVRISNSVRFYGTTGSAPATIGDLRLANALGQLSPGAAGEKFVEWIYADRAARILSSGAINCGSTGDLALAQGWNVVLVERLFNNRFAASITSPSAAGLSWTWKPSAIAVTTNPSDVALLIGGTQKLTAVVTNSSDLSVVWTSSNPATASVSNAGVITALASGVAVITATSNADASKKATAVVNVTDAMQRSVAGGRTHSLAIKSDRSLWSWGSNDAGQLGDGTVIAKDTPQQIMTGVTSVAAGQNFSLALKTDQTVWAWGDNTFGQLGDGSNTQRNSPVRVLTDARTIVAGIINSFAIKTDGSLWAWGAGVAGALGDGSGNARTIPTKVLSNVRFFASNGYHSIAVLDDQTRLSWGDNSYNQLGIDTTLTKILTPTPMGRVDSGIAFAAAHLKAFALGQDGNLKGWGNNFDGTLADGTFTNRIAPAQIAGNVWRVACNSSGADTTCGLIERDGTLQVWGSNAFGQVGNGTTTLANAPITVLSDVKDVAFGNWHSFAVKADGSLWAWGKNDGGQIGDGTKLNRLSPVQVLSGVMQP